MARYSYTAVDVDGREMRGGVDAASEVAARAALASRNLLPVKLAPDMDMRSGDARVVKRGAAAVADSRARLGHKDRMIVTRQLATLIDAAVSVDEALGIVAAQQDHSAARKVMSDLREGVQEGMRLSDAMGRHKASFPGAFRAAVGGGERSGKLGTVLKRLADHLAREQSLRSKITTAMVYPAALLFIATGVVTALMIFVVPTLVEQFRHLKGNLPLITRILIGVSETLTHYWPVILLGLLGAGVVVRTAFRQATVRLQVDTALLKAPVIGKWVKAVNASRFIRSVGVMTASGLPVLESVRASRDSAPNLAMSRAIVQMADRIEEGEPLSHAMQRSQMIPSLAVYMAVGGENSGELPQMLDRAADHLDEEFEAFIQAALSLVEPIIILIMGGIVASIILAIMLPILQLNQLAGS